MEDDGHLREAWRQLEEELVAHRWTPSQPSLQPFGFRLGKPGQSMYKLAEAYLVENEHRIRTVVCKDRLVRIEFVTATGAVSALADALLAAGIPFVGVANLLCTLGLTKFCQNTPTPNAPIKPASAP